MNKDPEAATSARRISKHARHSTNVVHDGQLSLFAISNAVISGHSKCRIFNSHIVFSTQWWQLCLGSHVASISSKILLNSKLPASSHGGFVQKRSRWIINDIYNLVSVVFPSTDKDHFVNAPSQCNVVCHWLGAYTKLSLNWSRSGKYHTVAQAWMTISIQISCGS